ncbi:type II CRISPR RNA-guided endonuclease Cas9 [Mangrovibacterium sp.]|uniref:type II CRISPR RNA-guided endonuclease Cas9 n=1 Tax=Mangrovibacterium sp. TaxID=1961364 RepID=UPI0035625E20
MAKILGLDLGTNSIGWAVVDATMKDGQVERYLSISDSGVRIFPEGVEPNTIGQGDKEQSKNATRREHRQMRRQFYRKKLRKVKLLEALVKLKMCPLSVDGLKGWSKWEKSQKTNGQQFPSEPDFVEWLKLNPYELRAKALDEQLSMQELGRIFYHFIQRRGFLSSRKGSDDGAIYKGKENMSGIDSTRVLMDGQTLGKALHDISYKPGEKYHNKIDKDGKALRLRARYTQRDMYIDEFQRIWEKQAARLDLDRRVMPVRKIRFLKGSLESPRNQHKLEKYKEKYGENNLFIEDNKVTSIAEIPLKKYFAGEIEELDGQLKFKSNESLLFWQRPLRSQKNLLDNCRFENNRPVLMTNGQYRMKNGELVLRSKKPCPLSHPEFELFRAYQFINNIRYGKGQKLTLEQRQQVLELMNGRDGNFNFEEIPKALKLTYEKFNYDNDQKIAGNTTIKKLTPLFPASIWERNYEVIWHCFYFYDDNERLFAKLKKDFQLKVDDPDKISKIRLKDGYSNVSLKAIRNINPFLEKGYLYADSVVLGGVKNAFGYRWGNFEMYQDEIERAVCQILREDNKEGEGIEKIKEWLASPVNSYGFSKKDPAFSQLYHHSQEILKKERLALVPELENLRNPIVQQALQEMRRLVNSLLKKYREKEPDFSFDRIHVEMGRDLKNNKTKRQDLTRKIRDNEKKNDEARKRLEEFGLRPTRDNLLRYLLYDEIQMHVSGPVLCPYTGKVISMADLIGGGNTVQIEHMVPYSVSLDDSFGNKTLCEANFNRMKGEKTPYEFYLTNPDYKLWGINKYPDLEDGWKEISERAFKVLPYPKAKRFTVKKKIEKTDFIERQLNDTRYISRKAVESLSAICSDVRMLPGQVTAELRHLWGINNILNPVLGIENFKAEVRGDERLTYYVVTDEDNRVLAMQRKSNDRPETGAEQLVLTGAVNKGAFSSKYLRMKIDAPNLKDGEYWAVVNVSAPHSFQSVFAEKPDGDEQRLVFKGRVEKQFFTNDTVGKRIKAEGLDNGAYWASFSIKEKQFKLAEGKGKLKTSGSSIALFGEIRNGQFSCHIYQCETSLPDGKYWALLELDFEQVDYVRAVNPKPEPAERQLISYTTVDEDGWMAADPDPGYRRKVTKAKGRYYCMFDIELVEETLHPLENEAPVPAKGQRLTEATVWVDRNTGEIKYDPKKNRDDHRHHAIDAITVALTEQGFLQRLSTYHAQEENKKRGIDSTKKFPEPWLGFTDDVRKAAEAMFISHKQNNKILTKISKTVVKNGEAHRSVGFAARGQLHKETVFGKRKAPGQSEDSYHIRKDIIGLKDKKQINKVVDDTIRKLILDHLRDNCDVDVAKANFSIPKDAFFRDGQYRLFLPNRKGGEPVPVKKVRLRENIGNAILLKQNIKQYVNPRNNHHVLIYEDFDGKLQEQVVSFIEVVERQRQQSAVYKLPEDGKQMISTLEINDMFLLGVDEGVDINQVNASILSKHLYRVQKVSSSYYTFRHHLASTITNKDEEIYIQSFGAWGKYNPIKVTVDPLGNIKPI